MKELALHRYSKFMVAYTFLLIIAGGMVTSTHSGLSVPDWPLSFGGFFPRMVGGVFYEHGHRLIALGAALLTAGLVVWTWWGGARRVLKRLALVSLLAVLLQALLGGLTVLLKLPPSTSAGHAGLAQIFFCLILSMALLTSPAWAAHKGGKPFDPLTRALCGLTVAVVFIQILVGATIRHEYVGMAIPDFPLSLGRLVPPLDNWMVVLNFSHRVLALLIVCLAAISSLRVLRRARDPWVANPARLLLAAVTVQVCLGAFTIWTVLNPLVATAHVAGGALVLGSSLALALRARRAS